MGSGSVAKVMLDDVKSLHIFVADSTPLYARAIIMPLATIVILFWLDWRLAIATLGYWRLIGCSRARPPAFGRYGSALS